MHLNMSYLQDRKLDFNQKCISNCNHVLFKCAVINGNIRIPHNETDLNITFPPCSKEWWHLCKVWFMR